MTIQLPGNDKGDLSSDYRSQPQKFDWILLAMAGTVFAVLFVMTWMMLSLTSLIAIGIGASIVLYQIVTLQGRLTSKFRYGTHFPSAFFFFLLAYPFALSTIFAFDSYSLLLSVEKAVLLWGLTLTFWSTLLFVPLSLYSKYRECTLTESPSYPKISVIVPAYNEEKVVETTINGLLETRYPDKEIIIVDDGSTDRTLEIISMYKKVVTVLHKENGGKATAINFGLSYASGEIIVVIDADTIIGRESLVHLANGFSFSKDVAAVAGNIKVRNRKNWITWCQAVEYVAGIQIVRRALDVFGAISVVPGSLGAFKKSILDEIGSYHKATIVEDFDVTLKILKTKLIISGSINATAYTEAPETLRNLYRQRKRWYGGNMQVFARHSDALLNPRFGLLQRLVYPFMILSSIVMPFVGFITFANAILAVFWGNGTFVLEMFAIFCVLQCLQVAMAVRMDREDPKLILYAFFLVVGFKQILDLLMVRAVFEGLFKKDLRWTSVDRIGVKV